MKTEPNKSKPLTETKVEEVLSDKPPTLHPDDTLLKAGERMREMDAGEWPVAREEKLIGIMDQPNPDQAVARYGHDPKETLVGHNMSRNVAYCFEDQSCAEALKLMKERQVKFLPVVDRNERIIGIVSQEELLAKCSEEK